MYFCCLPYFLLLKNERSGGSTGERKDFLKGSIGSCDKKSSVYDCSRRAVSVRCDTLWKKCGCIILFHLCGGKSSIIQHLLHVYHFAIHYWCGLLSACISHYK